MKVGDLVRCVAADGWPIGVIAECCTFTKGFRMPHYRVLVQGSIHPFLPHQLEILK
jgi:hypothetical protein